jgi:hypothetical protein
MNPAIGSPSGFMLWLYLKTGNPGSLSTGDTPDRPIGSLAGVDPAAGGVFSYSTSAITLAPRTFYFVVANSAVPVSQGAYLWSASNGQVWANWWAIENSYYSSADGSSWTDHLRQNVFQLGIYGTPVPEPFSAALLGMGLVMTVNLLRCRKKQRNPGSANAGAQVQVLLTLPGRAGKGSQCRASCALSILPSTSRPQPTTANPSRPLRRHPVIAPHSSPRSNRSFSSKPR